MLSRPHPIRQIDGIRRGGQDYQQPAYPDGRQVNCLQKRIRISNMVFQRPQQSNDADYHRGNSNQGKCLRGPQGQVKLPFMMYRFVCHIKLNPRNSLRSDCTISWEIMQENSNHKQGRQEVLSDAAELFFFAADCRQARGYAASPLRVPEGRFLSVLRLPSGIFSGDLKSAQLSACFFRHRDGKPV